MQASVRSSTKTTQVHNKASLFPQIIKLSVEEGGKFYFYNNVVSFENEPHTYNISYEEHVCVMDEIYSRQIFMTPFLRFVSIFFL